MLYSEHILRNKAGSNEHLFIKKRKEIEPERKKEVYRLKYVKKEVEKERETQRERDTHTEIDRKR
jgi:hypothetical protein